jgi:hypothetical protein
MIYWNSGRELVLMPLIVIGAGSSSPAKKRETVDHKKDNGVIPDNNIYWTETFRDSDKKSCTQSVSCGAITHSEFLLHNTKFCGLFGQLYSFIRYIDAYANEYRFGIYQNRTITEF